MKRILFFISIVLMLNSCTERVFKNIYDPDSTDPSEWAPKTFVAQQISDVEVRLVWEQFDERADGFHLNRKIGNNETETNYLSFDPEIRSCRDTIIQIGQSQQYEILAFADMAFSSKMALEFNPIFNGPMMDNVIHKSATNATITWQPHEYATVNEYIIERSENSGSFTVLKQLSENEYTDANLDQTNEYSYRIKAITDKNTSDPGDTLNIKWGQTGYEQQWNDFEDYYNAVLSSDGQYIACWKQDLSLYETETGNNLWTIEIGSNIPNDMIISSDNQYIASNIYGNSFQVWNLNDGSLAWEGVHEDSPNNRVIQIAFSPDGSKIVSGDNKEGVVNLWTSAGSLLWTFTITGSVTELTFSNDNNTIAAGSDSGQIVLLDASNGNVSKEMDMTDGIAVLNFSNNGNYLAISLYDNENYEYSAMVKDLNSDADLLGGNHQWSAISIEFSNDDQYFLSSGYGDSTKVWNLDTGEHLFTHFGGPPAYFNATGDKIVCGGEAGVRVYTVPEGNLFWSPDTIGYTWHVDFVGNSDNVSTAGESGLMIWQQAMGWTEKK